MKMLKACLNWKVLAGLGGVGVVIYLVAPTLVAAALPILLLAVCPLSMLLMLWGMQRAQAPGQHTSQQTNVGPDREERIAQLRAQQATLTDRIEQLEREKTRPAGKEGGR